MIPTDIITAICGVIMASLGYFARQTFQRITQLEKDSSQFITAKEAREIVSEKLEPLKEDLREIKAGLEKLTDYILENPKKRD